MTSPLVTAVLPTIRATWEGLLPTYDGGRRFIFARDNDLSEGASAHRTFRWFTSASDSTMAHSPTSVLREYSWTAEVILDHQGLSNDDAFAREVEDARQLMGAVDALAGTWPPGVAGVWADKHKTEELDGQQKRVVIDLRAIVEENNA